MSVENDVTVPTDPVVDTLSNYEVMKLERKSESIIDLNDRYWQFTMMAKVCGKNGGWEQTLTALQTQWESNHMTSALSVAWQQEMENISKEEVESIYAPLDASAIREFD